MEDKTVSLDSVYIKTSGNDKSLKKIISSIYNRNEKEKNKNNKKKEKVESKKIFLGEETNKVFEANKNDENPNGYVNCLTHKKLTSQEKGIKYYYYYSPKKDNLMVKVVCADTIEKNGKKTKCGKEKNCIISPKMLPNKFKDKYEEYRKNFLKEKENKSN